MKKNTKISLPTTNFLKLSRHSRLSFKKNILPPSKPPTAQETKTHAFLLLLPLLHVLASCCCCYFVFIFFCHRCRCLVLFFLMIPLSLLRLLISSSPTSSCSSPIVTGTLKF